MYNRMMEYFKEWNIKSIQDLYNLDSDITEVMGMNITIHCVKKEDYISTDNGGIFLTEKEAQNFIYEKYANIDEKQFESKAKLDYLHFLQENINLKNQRIDRMMLPSVVGIDDPNLIHGVEQLIALQMEKNQLQNLLQ